MRLVLRRLEISNFKGIKHKVIEFGDKVTLVKGQNGCGKSTVGSCLSFIISDTDIELNKNPMVTPLGESECVTKVEAEIEIDGKPVTIAKIQKYKEKTDDDGKTTSSVTNSYEVNSILKNQKDFMADIEERGINVDNFLILTNPNAFTSDTSKKGREQMREVLFKMADEVTDEEIAEEVKADDVKALLEKGYRLDEIEAKAKSEIKKVIEINGKDNSIIDGRIQGILDSKVTTDIKTLRERESALKEEIEGLKREIEDIKADKTESKVKELEYKKSDIENTITNEWQKSRQELDLKATKLESEISVYQEKEKAKTSKFKELSSQIEVERESLENYRELFKKVQDEVLDEDSFVCPTCQTPYKPERVEEIKTQFEESKNERLNAYKTQGEKAKERIAELEEQRGNLNLRYESDIVDDLRKQINKIDTKLEDLGEEPDFKANEEWVAICKEIEDAKAKADTDSEELIVALSDKHTKLFKEWQMVCGDIAVAERNSELDKQVADLREEKRNGEISKANNEKILNQVEEIKACKDDKLAESINKNFSLIDWHLWELQRNGERKPIAEPFINGKPMSTCANGSLRTIAKISICKDLQRFMNCDYPIFCDDYTLFSSNSIEQLNVDGSQLIGLVVSEDKELVIEKGE